MTKIEQALRDLADALREPCDEAGREVAREALNRCFKALSGDAEAKGGFCTECRHQVASFEGLNACPNCGSTGVPCANSRTVLVEVNWHELHLLGVWAENFQRAKNLGRVVYSVTKALEAQHPDLGQLTLAGELGEISKSYEMAVSDPALRRDIAEQTGEEVGLAELPKKTDGDDVADGGTPK